MLFGLVAFGFVTNDELKAQLLSKYRLLTTHPAAAAAQLGLDETGQQTVNQTCGATIRQPATQVSLQVYIERYHLVVENAETFGFDGYLRAWWTDPRLRFDPACSNNLMLARNEALQIWRPDLYFEQATVLELPHSTTGVQDGKADMLRVSSGGEVFWSRQARFTFSCKMTLEKLPFDTQRHAPPLAVVWGPSG